MFVPSATRNRRRPWSGRPGHPAPSEPSWGAEFRLQGLDDRAWL